VKTRDSRRWKQPDLRFERKEEEEKEKEKEKNPEENKLFSRNDVTTHDNK